MNKYFLPLMMFFILMPLWAKSKTIQVVTSFSILGDLVTQIGGDAVVVNSLVGAGGDAHTYEPTPQDAKSIAAADMIVMNGLNFEGWLRKLVQSTGSKAINVTASDGIKARSLEEDHGHAHGHDHEEYDPHAWQNVAHVQHYVKNIEKALILLAPERAKDITARAKAYDAELAALDADIKKSLALVPTDKRKILTSHDAFGYFGDAYGIQFLAPQGVSTDAEPKPADVAKLVEQIKKEGLKVYFIENMSSPRLIEQIAKDTGAKSGGSLYADALSGKDGPAATYVDMMRHNAALLLEAMK